MAHLLLPGQSLKVGESLESLNRTLRLLYQADGNLVLLQGDVLLWQSHTYGTPPGECLMQAHDGAFVVVDAFSQVRWSSTGAGPVQGGSHLLLTDDAELLVKNPRGQPVWTRSGLLDAPQLSFSSTGEGVTLAIDSDSSQLVRVPSLDRWQTRFWVKEASANRLQLRPLKGAYLTCDRGGGGGIAATAPQPGEHETFTLQLQPGRGMSLQAANGRHFLSLDGRIDPVRATAAADRVGAGETFQVTARNLAGLLLLSRLAPPRSLAYVALRPVGEQRFLGDTDAGICLGTTRMPDSQHAFALELLGPHQAALKTSRGGYCTLLQQQIQGNSPRIGPQETFSLEWSGQKVAFKTAQGRYLTVHEGRLIAGGVAVPGWFEVSLIAPGLVLTPPARAFTADRLQLLLARHSRKALEVAGTTPGSRLVQKTRSGQPAQLFAFEPVGDGYYFIRSALTGQALEVKQRGTHDGADVIQNPLHGGEHQQFLPIETAGALRLMARHSGLLMGVAGVSVEDGASVETNPWREGGQQQFECVQGYLPRRIKLLTLLCYRSDESGGDNPYLKISDQVVWSGKEAMSGWTGAREQADQLARMSQGHAQASMYLSGELLARYFGTIPATSRRELGGITLEQITPDRPLEVALWESDHILRGGDDHYGHWTLRGDEPALFAHDAGVYAQALVMAGSPAEATPTPPSVSPFEQLSRALSANRAAYLLFYSVM